MYSSHCFVLSFASRSCWLSTHPNFLLFSFAPRGACLLTEGVRGATGQPHRLRVRTGSLIDDRSQLLSGCLEIHLELTRVPCVDDGNAMRFIRIPDDLGAPNLQALQASATLPHRLFNGGPRSSTPYL